MEAEWLFPALEGVGSNNSGRESLDERRDLRKEEVPSWVLLL